MLENLRAIWTGYLQFGLAEPLQMTLLVIDILLIAIVSYLVLQRFNTRRGILYLSAFIGVLLLLIITAYLVLPGVHFLAQILLVALAVGLPLYFHDTWVNLFNKKTPISDTPKPNYLTPVPLILVSLVLAVVLVLFSHGGIARTAELPQKVTIAAVNLPTGTSANLGDQTGVQVIVSAPRGVWDRLTSDSFSATVDVANQKEGTYDLPVTVTSQLTEVKIINIKPKRVSVTVEPIIVKTVTLVAKFSGKAGEELVPDEPVIDPEKVEVSGPKSVITDLTQAVLPIKLNGETKPIATTLAPVALTPGGEIIGNLQFKPTEVKVTVGLVKAGKLKTVGIRPVLSGQPAAGFWVKTATPSPGTVTLTGTPEALDKVTDVPTQAVSVAGINSVTTVNADLNLPSGVTLAESIDKVSVKVELAEASTTKTLTPEIVYENLSGALKVASITPTSISTVVSGPSSVLNPLVGGEVKLKLDLSAYKSAGTYSVTIKNEYFTLPTGITLASFLPSVLEVKLEDK